MCGMLSDWCTMCGMSSQAHICPAWPPTQLTVLVIPECAENLTIEIQFPDRILSRIHHIVFLASNHILDPTLFIHVTLCVSLSVCHSVCVTLCVSLTLCFTIFPVYIYVALSVSLSMYWDFMFITICASIYLYHHILFTLSFSLYVCNSAFVTQNVALCLCN